MIPYSLIVFVAFTASFSFPAPSGSVAYYVTPTQPPNPDCPQPCYTLDYYALNTSLLSNRENVSLLFLEGNHTLHHSFKLRITNTKVLVVAGIQKHNSTINHMGNVTVLLSCGGCGIEFRNISFLTIESCVFKSLSNSELLLVAKNILLNWMVVQRYTIKLAGMNIMVNKSSFVMCIFDKLCLPVFPNHPNKGNLRTVKLSFSQSMLLNCYVIGPFLEQNCIDINNRNDIVDVQMIFSRCTITRSVTSKQFIPNVPIIDVTIRTDSVLYRLEISDSYLNGGITLRPKANNVTIILLVNACTITGSMYKTIIDIQSFFDSRHINIIVHFRGSIVSGNNILQAVKVCFEGLLTNNGNFTIINSTFRTILKAIVVELVEDSYWIGNVPDTKSMFELSIINATFSDVSAGALKVVVSMHSRLSFKLFIIGCTFNSNLNMVIDVRKIRDQSLSQSFSTSVVYMFVANTTVKNNEAFKQGPVVEIVDINRIIIEDCLFIDNWGTALAVYFSDIAFSGHTVFTNNTGIKGGALALYHSFILLSLNTKISFVGNIARDKGGSIYVKTFQKPGVDIFHDRPLCFCTIDVSFYHYLSINEQINTIDVWFQHNSALHGGDDIYGGGLYGECRFILDKSIVFMSRNVTDNVFHLNTTESLSLVASDPTRVCLCDNKGAPQCANIEYICSELPPRYPGEVFTVSAVVVGYDFGTVRGIVYSELLTEHDGNFSIDHTQHVQALRNHQQCTYLNFSIHSAILDTVPTLQLRVNENTEKINDCKFLSSDINKYTMEGVISEKLQTIPVHINVPIEKCPTGFTLTSTPPYICTCHPALKRVGITVCVIANHTGWVYRSGSAWVSDSFSENETNSFVMHGFCPYDYCKSQNISIDLNFPDKQCAFSHSGVLCGGCYGNFSLVLGSSRCLPCDNHYLSLLIVFAFAGIALVFFIKLMDFTVSKGTVSGLILYANIIWANKNILFPLSETPHKFQQILRVFIAWLNFDLGIETPFVCGLDAYWKTWLQFVFPLYVWSITGVIIFVSHYSTRASKILGNNSVPVLATLVLLSYNKLLHIVISSLGFCLLDYPEGSKVVWSFDGNVPYFGAAHTILFLVALLVLILLWLPYTTVLLTIQWLRKKSYLKPLRWINTWKPFFDAYCGELKSQHHYWVGLLLLVRIVLLVLFAATSAIVPRINILAIVILGLSLFVYMALRGLVYKSVFISIFEGSFIMNLTVLGMTKLYLPSNDPANTPLIYTSVGIVFTQFLALVIYHTLCRLKSMYISCKHHDREEDTSTCTSGELRAMPTSASYYREPLLESSA